MNYTLNLQICRKLLDATRNHRLVWRETEDGWYAAEIGGREICVRFLYFEATNQPGADRRMIELFMPGADLVYSCGTEGFDILLELISEAFGWEKSGRKSALEFLEKVLDQGPPPSTP